VAKTKYAAPGSFANAAAFRAHLRSIDPRLDCVERPRGADGPLGQSLEVHGFTLANRFAIHPMEGWDGRSDGLPGLATLRRWRRFGKSGAALIWGGEAFAVQRDGRANPHQLFFNPEVDVVAGLRDLLAAVQAGVGSGAAPLIGLQLTHSGRFACPEAGKPAPRIAAAHPVLDARLKGDPSAALLTDGELEAIAERYVESAALARRAGFAFVDVKCCHGYLLHELLGAHTRPGPYGGSLENRTRLLRTIVTAIRCRCPDLAVAVRLSMFDVMPHAADPASGVGVPAGLDPSTLAGHSFGVGGDEPFALVAMLRDLGIQMLSVTLGSPYYCPHVQRPAAFPPSDGYLPPEDPLASVGRHLHAVRRCKAAFPDLIVVGAGYSYLQEYLPHVAEHEIGAGHADLVGIGRMVLSYPELPKDVLAGRPLDRRRICRTFSDCTTGPRQGLPSGCYPLDPYYRSREEAASIRQSRTRRFSR
jgi:2,4-dienoyl-CoA reductase-like NADH-dependent reductase (Old Yellow Enzyme family)